jgi:hypothetical protein
MSIVDTIRKNCVQTAVYWAPLGEDGYGSKIFADPYEIACRWENKEQWIRLDDGNQISSRAIVYVLQVVETEGVLCLGTLDDLNMDDSNDSSAAWDNPLIIDGAYTIKKFEASPVLGSTTEFAYKAWLTPLLT